MLYPFIDEALGLQLLGALDADLRLRHPGDGAQHRRWLRRLLDLGYAAFFAIGAYTIGFLTSPEQRLRPERLGAGCSREFWPALAVAWVIVAAIFGVLLGAPTLRLRGDYLAIVTLGFGEIVPDFFLNARTSPAAPRD